MYTDSDTVSKPYRKPNLNPESVSDVFSDPFINADTVWDPYEVPDPDSFSDNGGVASLRRHGCSDSPCACRVERCDANEWLDSHSCFI